MTMDLGNAKVTMVIKNIIKITKKIYYFRITYLVKERKNKGTENTIPSSSKSLASMC